MLRGDAVWSEWYVLDESPLPEQLQSWERTREKGRARFLGVVTLRLSFLWWAVWLGIQLALYVLLQRGVFQNGFNIEYFGWIVLGPIIGWLAARDRWAKNETIYLASTQTRK
jgi:hypothetical protein